MYIFMYIYLYMYIYCNIMILYPIRNPIHPHVFSRRSSPLPEAPSWTSQLRKAPPKSRLVLANLPTPLSAGREKVEKGERGVGIP